MSSSDNITSALDSRFSSARLVERRDFLSGGAAILGAAMVGVSVSSAHAQTTAPTLALTNAQEREFMSQAIKLMRQAGVIDKTGGPFGAVIVRDGKVLAASGNSVLRDNDPSAHAEVNAIRMACKNVGAPNLKGATMFTSCECCPMCYATAYWARVDRIVYAAAWTDYADLFDDSNISDDMKLPYAERSVKISQMMQEDAQKVWQEYRALPTKTRY
ncbi:nucleoside deaminase [Microvirga brassicacearum]|uniref:Nucleoside deaminase n=1 Tax=Microvirga brassicacearum TaxID=2580413 RepID=A0A5N3P4D8_9HYPH|nr:nucleoside deaminase [Microvirga brassicacearum]KAB0264597.1 nucleoside deaminase [Microvirga brassicacearum]